MTHAVPGITLTALGKEIEIRLSIQPLDAYIPCCTQHRESQLVIVLCQIRARGGGVFTRQLSLSGQLFQTRLKIDKNDKSNF